MSVQDIIKTTGQVPNKFITESGDKFVLFIRRKSKNKGYIASIWKMNDEVQESMLCHGEGVSPEEAKGDLKKKILLLDK